MKVFNLRGDDWDRTEDREGWRFKDAWVGAHIDAELIGASMYEVEPGNKQGPFHTHHANEEWVIVLRGEPTLRTHEGEQQLREGDVVAFPRGREGAHQVRNGTDTPIRVLVLSTLIAPDIVEYLDSGRHGEADHGRRHAAQQPVGRSRLAQRQVVDEEHHRGQVEQEESRPKITEATQKAPPAAPITSHATPVPASRRASSGPCRSAR